MIKNKRNQKPIRKNPLPYNEGNLRRWAELNLLQSLNHTEATVAQAADAVTLEFVKFYSEYPFINTDTFYDKIYLIFSYWINLWNELPKKSKPQEKNQWKDFIRNVSLPPIIISENILREWMYRNLFPVGTGLSYAINFMRTFKYPVQWENQITEELAKLFSGIKLKWARYVFNYDKAKNKDWEIFIFNVSLPNDYSFNQILDYIYKNKRRS